MKRLRLVNIVYAIVLFFFVLSGSPNLNGERLGRTLGITVILMLIVGYVNNRGKGKKQWPTDALVTMILLACAYLGMGNGNSLVVLILLWPLLHFWHPENSGSKLLLMTIQAAGLFCIIYFGINQFSFDNLWKTRILWMYIVFLCQYFFIETQFRWSKSQGMHRELGMSYTLAIISLFLFTWQIFAFKYAFYLLIATAPSFYILFRIANLDSTDRQISHVKFFRITALAALCLFNFYIFLDTTQVLQAVMGGY